MTAQQSDFAGSRGPDSTRLFDSDARYDSTLDPNRRLVPLWNEPHPFHGEILERMEHFPQVSSTELNLVSGEDKS
jgi:hypothetical protein